MGKLIGNGQFFLNSPLDLAAVDVALSAPAING